jgi:peptidoglycan/xylan/chitin deacetylase (PgdA/CDA1 family)
MEPVALLRRVRGKARRLIAKNFCRREVEFNLLSPLVSFTFDDAPRSAFRTGGEILKEFGARSTYFVSLGLLDADTEVGKIASADDLAKAVEIGDELGCHTYDHCDAWHTSPHAYLNSVTKNREALQRLLPGAQFKTFAYPKNGATLSVKPALSRLFQCCRGGGQTFNAGTADLNLLNACFIDSWMSVDLDFVKRLIDSNAAKKGWLILATHDIAREPTRYGCTPDFLRAVAVHAKSSGAALLPVAEACAVLESSRARTS